MNDAQDGFGCAHLAYLPCGHLGHLFPFPSSPTYSVTRSVVYEATAHITVRLCHPIIGILLGFYGNSVAVGSHL